MHSPGSTSDQHHYHWYSAGISRAEAEVLLKQGTPDDGYFLVRDSTSAPGDFVLSVVYDGEVIHYQIQQHGQDAFFSIDEGSCIHGLDALVDHYSAEADGLAVQLGSFHPGSLPPATARLHGTSTLLHRATEGGDLMIVSELLKAGYAQLNSKDGQGQTALHLAARLGRTEVLQLLVAAGSSVNVRDSHGLMPLHYAARTNHALAVRTLVDGGANLQARNTDRSWVPLHEAAHNGSTEALKTLLALNAPSRPRDGSDRTAADLARQSGHLSCANVLVRYKPPVPRRMRSDWLHGALSRADAEQLLCAGGFNSGDYLLRTSARKPGLTVLSMVHQDKVYHFEIHEIRSGDELRYVYIDDGPYLDSLEHLVEHYCTLSDGLQCRLTHPVPPSDEDARRAITNNRLEVLGAPPPLPLPRLPRPGTIVPADLEFGAVIGGGEFGRVYQGRWRDPRGRLVDVAIKTHQESSTEADRELLMREAACMKDLRHPCIVRFLGVVPHQPPMMVQELVLLGSLLDYLQDQPHGIALVNDLNLWAGQVAAGMEYLEKERLVHRDLAARNILLASRTQAKISDFGFSRHLAGDKDYYVAAEGGRWPIKWYAPEAINFGTFSAASDVWSFGVLLWEMFSYGEQPYADMPGVLAFQEVVEQGRRMEKPQYCPGGIYEVMLKCWAYDARERPSFTMLYRFFDSDSVYRNLSDLTSPQVVSLTSTQVVCLTGPPLPAGRAEGQSEPPAAEQYDVLSAARSAAPRLAGPPPPVPPKPARWPRPRPRPQPPDDDTYDSPRSHNVQPPRRIVDLSPDDDTYDSPRSHNVQPPRRVVDLSPDETDLLRRPAGSRQPLPHQAHPTDEPDTEDEPPPLPHTEPAAAATLPPYSLLGAHPLPPYSLLGAHTLSPYCRLGACPTAGRLPTLSDTFNAPLGASGLHNDTYDVPMSPPAARESDQRRTPPSLPPARDSDTYDVPMSPPAARESDQHSAPPSPPSARDRETYDVPASPQRQCDRSSDAAS